jgi:hypothetical protein
MADPMSVAAVEDLFTRSDGSYLCARWGRPIAPVVFGVAPESVAPFRAAFESVCTLAGHPMADTDPELGVNLPVFVVRDWAELLEVPDLDRMIDGLAPLVARLTESGANQYRVFRFERSGAIRACFVLLRMDAALAAVPAGDLALMQAAQTILLWSDRAFRDRSVLARHGAGPPVLRPDIAAVIRAAYDPAMPEVATDASHALRLHARLLAGRPS